MIYSGFCFFNEFDLLRIKLEATRGLDIQHLLVESNHTFSGIPKKHHFMDYKVDSYQIDYFSDFKISPIIDYQPKADIDPWKNEARQRNAIMHSLKDCHDDDIIIISDCDEIVSKEAILSFKPEMECAFLVMDKFDFYLNCREGIQSWNIAKICTWKYLKARSPEEIRNSGAANSIPNAGHHFSFQGGIDAIMEKFKSFSHQEIGVQKHAIREVIEEKLKTGQSLWGEDFWSIVPIDESFPEYIVQHQHDSLKHMIFHP